MAYFKITEDKYRCPKTHLHRALSRECKQPTHVAIGRRHKWRRYLFNGRGMSVAFLNREMIYSYPKPSADWKVAAADDALSWLQSVSDEELMLALEECGEVLAGTIVVGTALVEES